MDSFIQWFFQFVTSMFSDLWNGIVAFVKGIIHIFDFKTYFGYFSNLQDGMGTVGWVLSILAFVLVYAFWGTIIFLIVLAIVKKAKNRGIRRDSDHLLDEIASLHKNMDRLQKEKAQILALKHAGTNVDFEEMTTHAEEVVAITAPVIEAQQVKEVVDTPSAAEQSRFYHLTCIDEKYVGYTLPEYRNDINLKDFCDELRNYACYASHLYYEIKIIRLMIAGLSCTKMVLLQGISGTGKTSLPYCMGKYFENPTTIASVQPSWRDRSELFGFFNEFTKKFNETEVLSRIYESGYNQDMNLIILDEMNIARVEYYFAEMLSILEMPNAEEWKIQLVPSVWSNDPIKLDGGRLQIPQNVWYIGTANNDDTTFAVSDKVYDRAFVINLDSKGVAFDAPPTEPRRISAYYLMSLYDEAVEKDPVTDALLKKVEDLDNYVIEHFRVAFGNRIIKQFKVFVPVYKACGGTENEAVDYMLATKVFRKFESLNIGLIRDEIKGLINQLNNIFGKDEMKECIAYLHRLQKTF